VFCAEGDCRRAEAEVTQAGDTARVVLAGDLDAAAGQVCRFLALDVGGRGWLEVGRRDPVIAGAQARLPGLRPCGFILPRRLRRGRCWRSGCASHRPPGCALS
jgi:DNA-3-methyladenine glycosylase II